jgi:hypothetical protein
MIGIKQLRLPLAHLHVAQPPHWEASMRLAALTIVLFVLSGVVVAKEPTFLGSTRADPAITESLSLGVISMVKSDCAEIDKIQIADIPSDFVPAPEYKAFSFELWTAIGCNVEFPIWVGWDRTGVIQIFGKYRSK